MGDANPSVDGGPDAAVVIVNWNTRERLRRCLESLEGEPYSTLVVDNGSSDGSAEMVRERFPGVELIANGDNVGFARANNQALERTQAEFVALVNSDAVLEPRAVRELVEFARERKDCGAVGGRLHYPDGSFQPSCFRFPNLYGLLTASLGLARLCPGIPWLNWDGYGGRDWSNAAEVDFAVGALLLLRRAAAQPEGWFDPDFFLYGEEADLCARLQARGWKVAYHPAARAQHERGGSVRSDRDRARIYESKQRAILLFLSRHRGLLQAWIGNAILLASLLPRAPVWTLLDLRDRLREKDAGWSRLCQARVAGFHFAALVSPGRLRTSWAPKRAEPAP